MERLLVREWGMPRPALVAYRRQHLVKPDDWFYQKDVGITATGLAKLQRHCGLEQTAEKAPVTMEGAVVRCRACEGVVKDGLLEILHRRRGGD